MADRGYGRYAVETSPCGWHLHGCCPSTSGSVKIRTLYPVDGWRSVGSCGVQDVGGVVL